MLVSGVPAAPQLVESWVAREIGIMQSGRLPPQKKFPIKIKNNLTHFRHRT
jgi:hypothetical protein